MRINYSQYTNPWSGAGTNLRIFQYCPVKYIVKLVTCANQPHLRFHNNNLMLQSNAIIAIDKFLESH